LTSGDVRLVEWHPDLESATIDLLARAFSTNPIHIAAFGVESVVACNRDFFRAGLSLFRGRRLVAMDGPRVIGFAHWAESPHCRIPAGQRLRLVPVMLRSFGLRPTLRVGAWLSAWGKNDPPGAHWHFGPIGVAPEAQRKGVGRRLMDAYCGTLDERGSVGFLETDKPENVSFYRKWGFAVTTQATVIGATTYFMTRPKKPSSVHSQGTFQPTRQ